MKSIIFQAWNRQPVNQWLGFTIWTMHLNIDGLVGGLEHELYFSMELEIYEMEMAGFYCMKQI
jgi:hypothetical protein